MKKEVKLGVFLLAAFAILGFFIIKTESCIEFFSRGKRYPVHARFATVAGMYVTAPVRLAGVKIGVVEKISLEDRKAVVIMRIDNSCRLLTDARAIISTVGFVGEKYVEIVYKDEFKAASPGVIPPGGEILVIEPFNLDELKSKFDNIYERTIRITDSLNEIVSDKDAKEALRASFLNLREVSQSLKNVLAENGQVSRAFADLRRFQDKLAHTAETIDHLAREMDSAIADGQQGMLRDLKSASRRIDALTADLAQIGSDLRQGKGTAGKLLQDERLYKKIDDSVRSVNELLRDLERKKDNLNAITFNYAVHFDYFSRMRQGRLGLDLAMKTANFRIVTGVNADPAGGRPLFTVMGGKDIAFVSLAAGLVESDLGAALGVSMLKRRLRLDIYAYRFGAEKEPLLKTTLRFSLSRNIHVLAGYTDLLRARDREFMMGISLGN